MDKIIYRNITSDDSLPMIIQELINKQAEIVEWINGLCDVGKNSLLCKDKW